MPDFRNEEQRRVVLSERDEAFILGAFPDGTRVRSSHYFDNFNLPCPMLVTLALPGDKEQKFVFKRSRDVVDHFEPEILGILKDCGLPVPSVLRSGPGSRLVPGKLTLMEFLPGTNVQKFSSSSDANLEAAKGILVEGIARLHGHSSEIAKRTQGLAPRVTMEDTLQAIESGQSAWSTRSEFRNAIRFLKGNLPNDDLIFTNGDYQPANFLTDGKKVTAYLDFEGAKFEDRLIGFAKYMIYDLAPLNRVNLVGGFLDHVGATAADFAPRLALGCLATLQKGIEPEGGNPEDQAYRERVLDILVSSIRSPAAIFKIGTSGLYRPKAPAP